MHEKKIEIYVKCRKTEVFHFYLAISLFSESAIFTTFKNGKYLFFVHLIKCKKILPLKKT